jgi:hypothetical protein
VPGVSSDHCDKCEEEDGDKEKDFAQGHPELDFAKPIHSHDVENAANHQHQQVTPRHMTPSHI